MKDKGPMNRIWVVYRPSEGNIASNLRIYNDIKGLTCTTVGNIFYGNDADIMFEYFKNASIKKNDKVMRYGVYIEDKDGLRYAK